MPNRVVILIFTHKPGLEWFEEIALKQCFRVLGRYPIRLVCPAGLDLGAYRKIIPDLEADFIPPKWFSSRLNYNRLKILPLLYRRFAQYQFILTYELDAFVFRDELLDWCAKDFDYIGAPWFVGYDSAKPDAPFLGVGNSGFSLRRTQAVLEVLNTWRFIRQPSDVVGEVASSGRPLVRRLASIAKRLVFNNFHPPFTPANTNETNTENIHDDCFWCLQVPKRFPDFKIACIDEAKRFSFEVNPSRVFAECERRLPFGCHKWMTYEPEFWKPHIEQFGYNFPDMETIKTR
jgi:hypothetical protein